MNLILNFWHCGGCLNKRARGYAARSSTRHKRKQPNKKKDMNAERKGRSPLNRLANRPFSRSQALSLNLMLFSIGLFFILSAFCFPFTCDKRRKPPLKYREFTRFEIAAARFKI